MEEGILSPRARRIHALRVLRDKNKKLEKSIEYGLEGNRQLRAGV